MPAPQQGNLSRRYVVAGRVQGVGFRWFVLREAKRLELKGWVRNRPDGSVEVQAVGTIESLAAIERALRRGPAASHVEKVDVADVPHEAVDSKSFEIKQ